MVNIIKILIATLTVTVFAAPGKYPDCAKGKVLKGGDKFDLQFDFQGTNDGDLSKVLFRMGMNSNLPPEFPRMAVGSMGISFSVQPNPNFPEEKNDPKELDRMARLQLEKTAELKNVRIYCD